MIETYGSSVFRGQRQADQHFRGIPLTRDKGINRTGWLTSPMSAKKSTFPLLVSILSPPLMAVSRSGRKPEGEFPRRVVSVEKSVEARDPRDRCPVRLASRKHSYRRLACRFAAHVTRRSYSAGSIGEAECFRRLHAAPGSRESLCTNDRSVSSVSMHLAARIPRGLSTSRARFRVSHGSSSRIPWSISSSAEATSRRGNRASSPRPQTVRSSPSGHGSQTQELDARNTDGPPINSLPTPIRSSLLIDHCLLSTSSHGASPVTNYTNLGASTTAADIYVYTRRKPVGLRG